MKQAQSNTSRYPAAHSWRIGDSSSSRRWRRTDQPSATYTVNVPESHIWSSGQIVLRILGSIWFILILPFRLIFWTIAWAGRLTVVVLGFSLMVVGMALWAGPFFFIGIPMFLIGLVLTLRCLD